MISLKVHSTLSFSSTIPIVSGIAAIVLLALYFDPTRLPTTSKTGKKYILPPKVPLSFLLPRVFGDKVKLFNEISKTYGDIVYFHVPFRSPIILFLGKNASKFYHSAKPFILDFYTVFKPWFIAVGKYFTPGSGLTPTGHTDKVFRGAFTGERLSAIVQLFRDEIPDEMEIVCKGIRPGESVVVDVFEEMFDMVLRLNCKAILGREFIENDDDFNKFKRSFIIAGDFSLWISKPIYLIFPSLGKRTREHHSEATISILASYIRKRMNSKPVIDSKTQLLGHFIEGCYINGELDYEICAFICVQMVMASYVNSSAVLGWLLYHVSRNEDIRNRIQSEMQAAVGFDQIANVKSEDLDKMLFFDSLVREIIRYVVTGASVRVAQEDIAYQGYDIPEGSFAAFPHQSTHMNEDLFSNPADFIPDRHIIEVDGEVKFNFQSVARSELLSFGAGRHPCAGMKFALNEMKLIVIHLFRNFDFEVLNSAKPKLEMSAVSKPTEKVLMRLTRKIVGM